MGTITDYFEQAQLAMAAYATGLLPGMFGGAADGPYRAALTQAGMSQKQAEAFANTYTVIARIEDFSGFSATILSRQHKRGSTA